MKITELKKDELCELVKRLLMSRNATCALNGFLLERQEKKFNELITEFEKIDPVKDFAKFKRINKRLDRLHNDTNYYLQLDEPGKEKQ